MYTRTICIHNNSMCATESRPTIYPPDRSPPPVVISYTILYAADREMALRGGGDNIGSRVGAISRMS
jgi:hypothetical protein